jgi:hypothetical protein
MPRFRFSLPHVEVLDGVLMCGRFSIGWNFHPTRHVYTIGLALAFALDRCMLLLGPFMLIWLYRDDDELDDEPEQRVDVTTLRSKRKEYTR